MPVVVIVTAYDKFAIQAFEAGAIDYLLKPIGQERLAQAVERAKQTSRRERSNESHSFRRSRALSTAPRVKKIVGRVGEEYFLLDASEIFAFQADGDVVWIITAKHKSVATERSR